MLGASAEKFPFRQKRSPTSLFKAMVVRRILRRRLGAERMEDQLTRVTQASESELPEGG